MNSCAVNVNGVGLFPAPSLGSDPSSQPTDGMRKAWRYMPQKNKYMRMAAVMPSLVATQPCASDRARTWPRKGGLLPPMRHSQSTFRRASEPDDGSPPKRARASLAHGPLSPKTSPE